MTDLRKAAEMALFRLLGDENHDIQLRAAIALLQALAQSEKETLTLDRGCRERGCVAYDERDGDGVTVSIREWVGLTDEEVAELRLKTFDAIATNHEVYRAIEAKLKEKNA